MNIAQKLQYSQCIDRIYFFREGMFAQLYGVSLYLAITRLNLDIKLCIYRYKSLSNKPILRAGLPTNKLEKLNINGLLKTDFGYEYVNNWNIDHVVYRAWYESQLSLLLNSSEKLPSSLNKNLIPLWLTEREYSFLISWQQGKYPVGTEFRFVERLSKKIASSYV